MRLNFIIIGNQEDPEGNPIPYRRATQHSTWSPEAKRYEAWKEYVQKAFSAATKVLGYDVVLTDEISEKIHLQFAKRKLPKPIRLKNRKMRTDIFIHWANNAHGDPDNILKGINDALYQNDKLVAGSVDFAEKPTGKGMIEVTLTL